MRTHRGVVAGISLSLLWLTTPGASGQVLMTRGGAPQPPGTFDPARGLCGGMDITQSTDPNTVNTGTSIACYNGGNNCTVENDYARSFDLAVGATAGVAQFVRCVEYGVDEALVASAGSSPVTINLWVDSNGGPPNTANLVPLAGGSIVDSVPNGTAGAVRTVDFTANNVLVPADSVLVVTVESPDLCAVGVSNYYFNGANAAGQSAPSYIRAPGCGLADYMSLAAIGAPNQHMVLSVGLDPEEPAGVPTVSEWGLAILTLIGLVVGTILFSRKRSLA